MNKLIQSHRFTLIIGIVYANYYRTNINYCRFGYHYECIFPRRSSISVESERISMLSRYHISRFECINV